MRGEIRRAGGFTLTIEWVSSEAEIGCKSCCSTINGDAYTLLFFDSTSIELCWTCAYELQGDLEYAMR